MDSVGEGEGGMIERIALKHVYYQGWNITSSGWIHETSAQGWCTGMTQRDGMEREVGREDRDGEHM